MKKVNALSIVLLFTLAGSASHAAEVLTRPILDKVVQETDHAIAKRDVLGLLKYISPDVRITAKVRTSAGDQTLPMDYETYKTVLTNLWKVAKEYSYKREKLDVKISPDQKEATLVSVIRESYTIENNRTTTLSRATSTVRLIDGTPRISRIFVEELE